MSAFSSKIFAARSRKAYSQRQLAELIGSNYTYISKLENDRADYPPSVEVIESIAHHLDLDAVELIYLSGRITDEDEAIVRQLAKMYGKDVSVLLRSLLERPALAQELIEERSVVGI